MKAIKKCIHIYKTNLMEKAPSTHIFVMAFFSVFIFTTSIAYANESAPNKWAARYEVAFLTTMIDHHYMAVMMAEKCVEKAIHSELVTLCENIKNSQTDEIAMMQVWLADWYHKTHTPEMSPKEIKKLEAMGSMPSKAFEITFMWNMIAHHGKAVISGSKCLIKAFHYELLTQCKEMVSVQSEEILSLRMWLCEWYNRCMAARSISHREKDGYTYPAEE